MSNSRTIIELLQQAAGVQLADKVTLSVCEVLEVDTDANTCTVLKITGNEEINIPNVLLQASVDDGIVCMPAVGSDVVVMFSQYVSPFVMLCSKIDTYLIVANDSSIELDGDKISLNDGSYGGLVKVVDLVSKLNALEDKVNSIIAAFNDHIHPVSGSSTTPTGTPVTGTLTPTVRADLENTLVVHGKEL